MCLHHNAYTDIVDNECDISKSECQHYQNQQKALKILYRLKSADTPIKLKPLDELISLIEGE